MSGDTRAVLAELVAIIEHHCSASIYDLPYEAAAMTRARALLAEAQPARLRHCDVHGQQPDNAWGCPECVREMRQQLAQPQPVEPTDEELDKTLFKALRDYMEQESPFGGPTDEKQLDRAKARAVLRRWSRPAPEPVQPADEELSEFATDWWKGFAYPEQGAGMATPVTDIIHSWHFVDFLRAALQAWGRSAPEPVSVAGDPTHPALLAEAQPQPVEPTDEEIMELMLMVSDYRRLNAVKFARAVLARWGRPAPEPQEQADD